MPQPHHRPHREFPETGRTIIECELELCPHCEQPLQPQALAYVQDVNARNVVGGELARYRQRLFDVEEFLRSLDFGFQPGWPGAYSGATIVELH
jgi:hypothetical protein